MQYRSGYASSRNAKPTSDEPIPQSARRSECTNATHGCSFATSSNALISTGIPSMNVFSPFSITCIAPTASSPVSTPCTNATGCALSSIAPVTDSSTFLSIWSALLAFGSADADAHASFSFFERASCGSGGAATDAAGMGGRGGTLAALDVEEDCLCRLLELSFLRSRGMDMLEESPACWSTTPQHLSSRSDCAEASLLGLAVPGHGHSVAIQSVVWIFRNPGAWGCSSAQMTACNLECDQLSDAKSESERDCICDNIVCIDNPVASPGANVKGMLSLTDCELRGWQIHMRCHGSPSPSRPRGRHLHGGVQSRPDDVQLHRRCLPGP
ncbi:unnamed protein product [Mycena citricolor]|uniref:Uncharacterized protein n=1 Tax=Mycena citricolor TaxID=2018698 RepID=A0AAD2HP98_9AGAR|nr:unnamed protein product [Mycena citricolor]